MGHDNGSSFIAPIISLPKHLLVMEVVARVASLSFTDLFNLKMCCKEFLDAAEDSYVYQHVSLQKFPLFQWFYNEKELLFLNQCKESKNMDALYREGLREYFYNHNANNEGLNMMKVVAQSGHMEAKYVYGMIRVGSEDIELRKQGLDHLHFVRMSKCVIKCRKKMQKLISSTWGINMLMVRNNKTLCNNKSTCKGCKPKKGEWTLRDDDEDNDYDYINMCEYCIWDHELELFYRHFNVR